MNTSFNYKNIRWIKNITHKILNHSYLDVQDSFTLLIPNVYYKDIIQPKAGDIIVLYQTINNENVFTHLVTPIDDRVIEHNNRNEYRYGRNVKVLAITPIKSTISIHKTWNKKINLHNANYGNIYKTENLTDATNLDSLLLSIWTSFIPYFCDQFINIVSTKHLEKAILSNMNEELLQK